VSERMASLLRSHVVPGPQRMHRPLAAIHCHARASGIAPQQQRSASSALAQRQHGGAHRRLRSRCPGAQQRRHACSRVAQIVASSSAAASWAAPAGFNHTEASSHDADELAAPPPLPPTPKSSSLLDVFPYLARLALSERSLYWRLALALGLMIASKVAGTL